MKKLLAYSILATAAASMQAQAFKFDTPSDWEVRWDNSAKANLMLRIEDQDPSVYDPRRTKGPDGPNPLAAGLADDATFSVDQYDFASQRIDLLSEMDVIWKDKLGFRVSGSGWYDYAYENSSYPSSGRTRADSAQFPRSANSTFAYLTVQPGEYNDAAEDLHYRGGELLDAFVFANFDVGDASANVRVGRHTLYWGQTLLQIGGLHGFAGSMAAIDAAKGLGTPGTELKELFIPNDKISSTVQFADGLSVSAFYAMGFEPFRWPAAGTYFSLAELLTEDSECLTAAAGPNGRSCGRSVDYISKDSGDWGINVKYYIEPWDLEASVIYMNNTDRLTSGLYSVLGDNATTSGQKAEALNTNANLLGSYGWVYKDDIDTFGFSFAKEMWDISWGADVVYRLNNALNPDLLPSLTAPYTSFDQVGYGDKYPGPTGDTAHIVVNGAGFLDGEWGLWDGGGYIAELSLSQLIEWGQFGEDATGIGSDINKASAYIKDDNLCSNFAGRFAPTWYQVRSGWDFTALATVNYAITCKQAPNSAGGNEKVGSGSIGGSVDIDQVWNVALNYNIYYGPQKNGTAAWIKDRDNISLTVKRTF